MRAQLISLRPSSLLACRNDEHNRNSRRRAAHFQGCLAHFGGAWPHALVHRDVLSAAAADRQGARSFVHRDRAHHDDPASRGRDFESARRDDRRHGGPERLPHGGVAVLGRRPVRVHEPHARFLDAARVRDAGRHRQQHLAPGRDPDARLPLSPAQRPGAVVPRHGRQRRRSGRAVRRRRAARLVQLAHGGRDQRRARHHDGNTHPAHARRFCNLQKRRRRRHQCRRREMDSEKVSERFREPAPEQGAHARFGERRVPHDDAGGPAHLPAGLSRLRARLLAVHGRRVHDCPAGRRIHRRPRSAATCRTRWAAGASSCRA